MGDRANIVVETRPGERLFFYTHWEGANAPARLRKALALQERWDDGSYLARIIFDELTGLRGGTTGFGIDTRLNDNSHPLLVVNVEQQRVVLYDHDTADDVDWGTVEAIDSWSFEDYANLDPEVGWETLLGEEVEDE